MTTTLIKTSRLGDCLGRGREAPRLPQGDRCRVRSRRHHACRAGLQGRRRGHDRRPRPDGDARPRQRALASRPRARLSRHPRGARRSEHVHDEPLRTQPGVRRVRPRAAARIARSRALRGSQVRRHDGVRYFADLRRLGGHRRQERHSRLSRAWLRGRALEALRRSLARIRLGRSARPQGPRCGARVHRWAAEARFRDALRRRVADADRELLGRAAARQFRRREGAARPVHAACRAGRARARRDGEAPRHDLDPPCERHRHPRTHDRHRPRDPARLALLDPLAHQGRHPPARRGRMLGGALPDPVRALRHHPGELRRLRARRRQHGDGHRHDAAQHARGDPQGRHLRPHRLTPCQQRLNRHAAATPRPSPARRR